MWVLGWILLGLFLSFWVWLKIMYRVGCRTTLKEVGPYITSAMSRGMNGSRLRLYRTGTKYRLDFEKHVPPEGLARFDMVLDAKRCSAAQFHAAQQVLKVKEIEFEVVKGKDGHTRLLVHCGPDAMKAMRASRTVFMEAFGLSLEDGLRAGHFGYFNPDRTRDPMVGWEPERREKPASTDQPPPAGKEDAPGKSEDGKRL